MEVYFVIGIGSVVNSLPQTVAYQLINWIVGEQAQIASVR